MSLEEFIFSHPAQIALLGIQFQWTADTQVRARAGGCGLIRSLRARRLPGPNRRAPMAQCLARHRRCPPGPAARPTPQTALANAKTDKGVMVKNMKKTDALLRWGRAAALACKPLRGAQLCWRNGPWRAAVRRVADSSRRPPARPCRAHPGTW